MMAERNQLTAGLAAVLMLIDHVGAMFFPEQLVFRLIGRLSFPLFAYGIAQGVAHTSDFLKYFFRIFLTAVLSQPIYSMAFRNTNLNPVFTLAYGALVVWLWRRGKKEKLAAGILLVLSYWLKSSYSWYGVATIGLFAFYESAKSVCFYAQGALQLVYGCITGIWAQCLSLCAFPFAGVKWRRRLQLPRYFFYVFYPLHLMILVGIRALIF